MKRNKIKQNKAKKNEKNGEQVQGGGKGDFEIKIS
jgi:hypothetical protein